MNFGVWILEFGLGAGILVGIRALPKLRDTSSLSKMLQLLPHQTRWQANPYSRFQSIEELQTAARSGARIDVNRATVDDWLRLPGISIHQARSLVDLRKTGVQFYGLEDLAAALSVSVQHLQPFAPILQFCYYDPASLCTLPAINPNRASVEQLARVPNLDLYLARAIVQERQRNGRYQNIAELQQRLALPADLTAQLMHFLQF